MTGFWKQAAESQPDAMRMSPGYHKITITKAIRQKKDGTPMEMNGKPYIMLICENKAEEQAIAKIWLTEKAAPFMAKALSRLGFDLDAMDAAGVTLERFMDQSFCNKQFLGRSAWISVEQTGDMGQYDSVEFMHEDELPVAFLQSLKQQKPEPVAAGKHEAIEPDDIPF